MADTTGTGDSGSNPANAVAQAKATEAAAAAPTAPQESDAEAKTSAAKSTPSPTAGDIASSESSTGEVEVAGDVIAVDPSIAGSEMGVTQVSDDAEGGQSFEYGQKDASKKATRVEANAQKVDAYDSYLRTQDPDKVLYRAAGSAGKIGGESFDYGQKPKNTDN